MRPRACFASVVDGVQRGVLRTLLQGPRRTVRVAGIEPGWARVHLALYQGAQLLPAQTVQTPNPAVRGHGRRPPRSADLTEGPWHVTPQPRRVLPSQKNKGLSGAQLAGFMSRVS